MVMKLYAIPTPNVDRAILPLFFTNVDVGKELELVKVSLPEGQHRSPAYKAKQPFGTVPYFEDGDFGIIESRAIAKYLVDKYELTFLVGKSLKERATINMWVESEAQNFHPAVGPAVTEISRARIFKRPVNENLIAESFEKLNKVLDVYEARLSKHKYLAGDAYTLADLFHTPHMFKVKTMDTFAEVLEKRPHVKAWADDITSHPAFVKLQQLDWALAKPLY